MVNYNNTTLNNETFTGDQSSIPFINTTLSNCSFNDCKLDFCQFLDSSFDSCQFINCSFTQTNFNSCSFKNITISNTSFSDTDFSSATFTDYTFFNGNDSYSNCLFHNVNLNGLSLNDKIMQNCEFTNTDMTSCIFSNMDFQFSTFHNTILTGIQLSDINFDSTVFYELDLSDVDLSNTISLVGNSNDFISSNQNTKLPDSYEIRQSTVADTSGTSILSYIIGPFMDFNEKNLNGISFTDMNLTNVILTTDQLQNCTSGNIQFDTVPPTLKEGYKLVNGYIIGPYANIVGADLSGEDLSSVDFYWIKTDNNIANNSTIFPDNYAIYGNEDNGTTTGVVVGPNMILIQADITGFDLSVADLTGVRSGLTIGDNTTILPSGYKLEGEYILGPNVDLQQTDLTDLDLTNVDFTNCKFQNTRCTGGVISDQTTILPSGYLILEGFLVGPSINISDTDFNSLVLDFSSADLTGVRTNNLTNYENVTWTVGYSIVSDILLGPSISLVNDIVITGQTLDAINFGGSDLTSAEFTNCIFQTCSFDETTVFSGTNFTNSTFTDCSFGNTEKYNSIDFTSVTFSGNDSIFVQGNEFTSCVFENTDLTEYSLSNKNFVSTNFTNAILNTDLSDSLFTNCDLSEANLSTSILTNVVGKELVSTENTLLPDNYIISGQQLISTTYIETLTQVVLEPTSKLTNDTIKNYMITMLNLVSSEERANSLQTERPIYISTENLNRSAEIVDRTLTEIKNSDTSNSTLSITDLNIVKGYYVTLYNIGEEVSFILPTGQTLMIRKKNETSYDLFNGIETRPFQTVNVGYQGEYFGFIYTIGSVSGYYLGRSNICFPAGEHVLTNEGYVDFKELKSNKHEINGRRIKNITRTTTKEKYLVQIEKNALGINKPHKTTLVSLNHKILFDGKWLPAKHLRKLPLVNLVPYTGQTLYNVQLDKYYSMEVNNMTVETLKVPT
jgi:uncharacterized protein YjbI with pentapeptide repeats